MKRKDVIPILSLCCIVLLTEGCNRKQPAVFDPGAAESILPQTTTRKAATALQAYFRLKDALAADQSDKAYSAAGEMKARISFFLQDSTLQTGYIPLIRQTADSLLGQLTLLLAVKDESCEQQRIYFRPLSATLYRFLQQTEMKGITTYHQFCPMAFNETSGEWLSRSPYIENPYFGAKMLTCGETLDTLK